MYNDDLLDYIKHTLDNNENIFIHGIEMESHREKEKLKLIIENGLDCNYFTIFRTVRELGKVKDINSDRFDYAFMSRNSDKSVNVVFAIPDMLVNGKDMIPLYPQDYGNNKNDDGETRTFLDIVLSDGVKIKIPKEFIYGFYELDLNTKEIKFCKNDKFYLNLSKEEYIDFFELIKSKVIDNGYDYLLDLCNKPSIDMLNKAYKMSEISSMVDDGISKNVIDKIKESLNIKRGL